MRVSQCQRGSSDSEAALFSLDSTTSHFFGQASGGSRRRSVCGWACVSLIGAS